VAELPSGTVTLMFTDIDGSTRLVQKLGDEYGAVLKEQRLLLRQAVTARGGHEVDCRADELFAVFQRARDAAGAAAAAQQAIGAHAWPEGVAISVRIGLHTGEPAVDGDVYLGLDVNRAARICAAGHGGQILLSRTTRDLVGDTAELRDLGAYSLEGVARAEQLFQLVVPGLRSDFPAPRAQRAEQRRPRLTVPRRQSKATLDEVAWQVRRLMPTVPAELRQPLAELGAELFTAHRAARGAEEFLAQVDQKRLAKRLSYQRELAVVSQQAQLEAERLEQAIESVDTLTASLREVELLTPMLSATLGGSLQAAQIVSLHERTVAATNDLDEAVTSAAVALDPASYKLARTRYRGVYRTGREYVVPFVDDFGRERRREFHTLADAHDFRTALRLIETQSGYTARRRGDRAKRA
jgi:class 3 adenylate cyclase